MSGYRRPVGMVTDHRGGVTQMVTQAWPQPASHFKCQFVTMTEEFTWEWGWVGGQCLGKSPPQTRIDPPSRYLQGKHSKQVTPRHFTIHHASKHLQTASSTFPNSQVWGESSNTATSHFFLAMIQELNIHSKGHSVPVITPFYLFYYFSNVITHEYN